MSFNQKTKSNHLITEQTLLFNFGDGWLVSLFNGISTLLRLFNAKAILQEEQ